VLLAARAVPSDRPRQGRTEPAGHGPGGQVRPAPAAEPAERELCPRGRGAQRLHPGRLGRHRGGGALAAPRAHPGACPGGSAPARRRHHRARCWPAARRSRRGCGPMSGTTGPLPDPHHLPRCSTSRATAPPSIPNGIWPPTPGSCRPMPMPGTASSTGWPPAGANHEPPAGRTSGARCSSWPRSPARRWLQRPCNASTGCSRPSGR
jgi:hypothetical protein